VPGLAERGIVNGEMWIGFIGHCDAASMTHVNDFEEAVLALLPRYGATALARARRRRDQPDALPAELQILHFPSRDAYRAFLDDPDRQALLDRFGDVFTERIVVELEPPLLDVGRSQPDDDT